MKLLRKLRDTVGARLAWLQESREDVAGSARRMIRGMQEGVIELRRQGAVALCRRRRTRERISTAESHCRELEREAEAAMFRGDDSSARAILIDKRRAVLRLAELKAEFEEQQELVACCEQELRQLQERVREAHARIETLLAVQGRELAEIDVGVEAGASAAISGELRQRLDAESAARATRAREEDIAGEELEAELEELRSRRAQRRDGREG